MSSFAGGQGHLGGTGPLFGNKPAEGKYAHALEGPRRRSTSRSWTALEQHGESLGILEITSR